MSLHVGAERGVNCEHMQGLLTNLLQKHWEWQENRRKDLEHGKFKYKTIYMASLDVKTAFDVAKQSMVSKILSLIGTHGSRGRFAGRDAGRKRVCILRELRDGISLLQVHPAGRSGGPSVVGSGWLSTYFGKLKRRWKATRVETVFWGGWNLTTSTYYGV